VVAGIAGAEGSPSSASSIAAGPGQVLKTAKIGSVTVITNAMGLTLYWFVPDNATTSTCYGSCAPYWPPVFGTSKAGPGVTGSPGTIRRSDGITQATYDGITQATYDGITQATYDGITQATYDGNPLYSHISDSTPGQNHGNNLTPNGGLWHEVLVSG
jgi:predicted lipoprotein with Yx(FWY)xxD motif